MTAKTFSVSIDGYDVEMEHDGERWQCMVHRGRYRASLPALQDTGILEDRDNREHVVPAWVLGRIETWAEQHGWAD